MLSTLSYQFDYHLAGGNRSGCSKDGLCFFRCPNTAACPGGAGIWDLDRRWITYLYLLNSLVVRCFLLHIWSSGCICFGILEWFSIFEWLLLPLKKWPLLLETHKKIKKMLTCVLFLIWRVAVSITVSYYLWCKLSIRPLLMPGIVSAYKMSVDRQPWWELDRRSDEKDKSQFCRDH